MANTFITPDIIARSALATLYNTTVLLPLVNRDFESEFDGHVGDTVTYRKPTTFSVNEFTSSITVQNATETTDTVTLDKHLDVSFAVTSKELTLELPDFSGRLLAPAMEAIAQDVDGRIAEALVDAATAPVADGSTAPNAAFRTADARLTRAKMPYANRAAVLSPEAASDVLGDELFVSAEKAGTTDGLRDASIGQAFGFPTYKTQVFGYGSGDKGQADGVAFHRDALTFVSRTLALPMGVGSNQAAVASYKGLGIRVVKDYDINSKTDIISLDILIGIKALRAGAAVELDFGQGS